MELPFIYKYKPQKFEDFFIDSEIIDILKLMISMDNLNILLIGDSGTGKTSLIYTLMNEYYKNIPNINENILIINSLKEQGIQYYRNDVKLFCQTKCSIPNKKKIIILDDIDSINEQSQQVFRNCIDKYKNNVHFLASCTNIQKVIDSLQSRQTIIKLKPVQLIQFQNILNHITKKENIIINKNAEKFILGICNNSIRILLNYLEKFKLMNTVITLEIADSICTNISFNTFKDYTNFTINNDFKNASSLFYKLFDQGYSVIDIYDNYFLYIKFTDILTDTQKYHIIKLLCKYITIFHNIHEDELELPLFTNNLIQIFNPIT